MVSNVSRFLPLEQNQILSFEVYLLLPDSVCIHRGKSDRKISEHESKVIELAMIDWIVSTWWFPQCQPWCGLLTQSRIWPKFYPTIVFPTTWIPTNFTQGGTICNTSIIRMYPLLNVPLWGTYPQFRLYSDNSQLFTFPRMTLICRNLPEFLWKSSPCPGPESDA